MRVRESFRPGDGTLALLLACPGGKCVVILRGHRGRPPKEVDCPEHEGRKSPTPGRPRRNGTANKIPRNRAEVDQIPAAPAEVVHPPAPTSTVVEKQEEGPACVDCGRRKKLAAKGRCWACYTREKRKAREAPLGPRHPDVEAVGHPNPAIHLPAAARIGRKVRAERRDHAPPSTEVPSSGPAAGYHRLLEADLAIKGADEVKRAVRALALAPRNFHLDPEAFDRAVEEVLRAAQVAGWLDPDPSAPGRPERERERERG